MTAIKQNQRLDYLDAVRSFALLLGIVFHASLSFLPIFIGWAVMDVSTSSFITGFMMVSHSFRMELFFLIAGFFSHMVFHAKRTGSFIQSRLVRIAIPLVVGWFILRPLLIASWAMGFQSMRGEVHILAGLKIGFLSLATLPKDFLTGSHLWFLYYLLLITGITLGMRFITSQSYRLHSAATKVSDRIISWILNSPLVFFILAIPTGLCLLKMKHWGMDTPDQSLAPHFPVLIVYTGFFLFGWLLHRQQSSLSQFEQITKGRVALCFISTLSTLGLATFQSDLGHPHIALIRIAFSFSYALMMWTLVALTLGLFKRFFDKPSKTVRYISDASYWLYLVHLPIVIWLQIVFAELPIHWSLKLTIISTITILLALVLYDLFVRSTVIGKVLNGRRKPRVLFVAGRKEQPNSSKLVTTPSAQ